jgi:hypothetical protein
MTFFTHDQVVKTVSFLYPGVKNGWDYRALMEVADSPKFIPMSDAWIEAWTAEGIAQPSIEYLKQVWAENDLENWADPNNQPTVDGAQTL